MYQLSEEQIDYMLNDIRRRGVEMEDLQLNLLDHVCSIIEQNLSPDGDFEGYYQSEIRKFYRQNLWEIEEETIQLLIYKNYYTMKKVMLISGTVSAVVLSAGIFFKFMHWPGAAIGIFVGIFLLSFVFLPLMFILKIKEKQRWKDKISIALGAVIASMISVGILFKIMFWPGANAIIVSAFALLILVFLPLYYINGIRQPESKVNTIVTSVLLIAAAGLLMALVRSPKASSAYNKIGTANFVRSEQLLKKQERLTAGIIRDVQQSVSNNSTGDKLYNLCREIKAEILKQEIGVKEIDAEFTTSNRVLEDHSLSNLNREDGSMHAGLQEMVVLIKQYNRNLPDGEELQTIEITHSFLDMVINQKAYAATVYQALTQINQIQLIVLQNKQAEGIKELYRLRKNEK